MRWIVAKFYIHCAAIMKTIEYGTTAYTGTLGPSGCPDFDFKNQLTSFIECLEFGRPN